MIYLDNAATSWPKPPGVVRAVSAALIRCAGNPGRTSHHAAMDGAALIQECRERLAQLFFRLPSQMRIERRKRLIKEQGVGLDGHASRDCYALPLPA